MHFDFLICSERSGSNLITKILDSHPSVCGPFPALLIKNIGWYLFRYGDLQNDSNWRTLLTDVADYLVPECVKLIRVKAVRRLGSR